MGIERGEGAKERMAAIAKDKQDLFGRWMKHWGYEPEVPMKKGKAKG